MTGSPELYGYGVLALLTAVGGGIIWSIVRGWRIGKEATATGAARQRADDVRQQVNQAVDRQDDQAVQDALEAELIRSRQERP